MTFTQWRSARVARRAADLEADTRVVWTYALADAVIADADRAERLQSIHGTVRALEASAVGWSADLCPSCRGRRITPGHTGPYGPAGSLAECCQPCSTTSRAVDAVYRRDPMREFAC